MVSFGTNIDINSKSQVKIQLIFFFISWKYNAIFNPFAQPFVVHFIMFFLFLF